MFLIETKTSLDVDGKGSFVEHDCSYDADTGITYVRAPGNLTMVVTPTGGRMLFNSLYDAFIAELHEGEEGEDDATD